LNPNVKPEAVLLNANNKGYARVVLDQESLNFMLQNLTKIKSDLNRSYIWRILSDTIKLKEVTPE
jgi:hypothetical protein